jgi:Transposase and inactivated derivatives
MCRVLRVHHSGFYAWLKSPLSERGKDDRRLTGLIKQSWLESGRVYGYRKIHDDLRNIGESCCPNRVARLARHSGIKAQVGYNKKPGSYGGKPAVVATNQLKHSFDALAPDHIWVTDITYIRTYEGWWVSGCYYRLIFPSCYWLVYAISHENGLGFKCIINGRLAKKTKVEGDYSF